MAFIQLGLADDMRAAPRERRSITSGTYPQELLAPPVAGVAVTHESARSLSAYTCGITVISGDIGLIDRFLYKKVGEGDDRERAEGHPVYRLVHDAPNDYTTPMVFWQTLVAHVLGWGNAFAEIEWSVGYQPMGLHIITPNRVQVCVEPAKTSRGAKYSRVYYLVDGRDRIEYQDMIHIPGLGFDGLRGYSPLQMARRTLGLGIALETFGAAFFANGSWPGIALQHPGELSKPAQDRLTAQIRDQHQGPDQAFKLLILEEDMKVSKPITVSPDDSQWLEAQQLTIENIARILNIQPHKLKHKTGERPGGNLEASQIDHETGTLLPWTTKIDQELNRKLVVKQPRYYVEHNFNKLLKTDAGARSDVQKKYLDMGVITKQQVAQQENLPAPPETASDELSIQEKVDAVGALIRAGFDPQASLQAVGLPSIPHTGLVPVTVKPEEEPPPAPPADDGSERSAERVASLRALALAWVIPYVKREAARIRAAAKKPAELEAWARSFYEREHLVLAQQLEPLIRFRVEQEGLAGDVTIMAERVAAEHVAESRDEVLGLRARDLPFELEQLARRWEKARPLRLAERIMALSGPVEDSDAA